MKLDTLFQAVLSDIEPLLTRLLADSDGCSLSLLQACVSRYNETSAGHLVQTQASPLWKLFIKALSTPHSQQHALSMVWLLNNSLYVIIIVVVVIYFYTVLYLCYVK